MAKGNGERPAKKGTKDPLLEELKVAASKPNPPAEVPPRDTDKEDSGISAESIKREREEDALIDKNIEARRAAEAATAPEVSPAASATPLAETAEPKVPPELQAVFVEVPPKVMEKYAEITDPKKRERYVENLKIAQQKQVERENEERKKSKKPVKHQTQKPKAPVAEATKPEASVPVPADKIEIAQIYNPGQFVDVEIPEHGYQERAAHVEPEVGLELSPAPEGTPKEWRQKLRALIESAKEKIGAMSERGGQLVGYLAERGKTLDAQGAELSEKYFGKLGEKYNKLPTWQKIALGGSLAVGLGLTSSWIAGAYGTALFATRFAAMAGSFKSNQKLLEAVNKGEATGRLANTRLYKWLGSGSSEKSRNNTAMAKALVTSFGMTAALGVAAKELSDYHVADRIGSYIGEHVYNWTHADVGAETVGAGVSESVPLPPTTAATASGVHGFQAEVRAVDNAIPESRTTGFQAEVRAVDNATPEPRTTGFQAEVRQVDEALKTAPVTPGTMPEMPTVGASAHGYEGMMKDLLKHLPDTRPENIPDGSDLAKLYEAKASADPEEVGRAIHRIAMEHKFFTDNTSFRVDVGAHMSADAHGNVLFNGEIQAPAGAHMIPEAPVVSSAYHPETPAAPAAEALPNVTAAEAAEGIVITETPTGPFKAAEPFISPVEAPVVSAETPSTIPAEIPPAPVPEAQPLPAETVMTPDTTVTRVDAPEFVSEPHVETPPVHAAEAVATQAPAPVVEQGFISNQLGLRIPVAESHIYAGTGAEDLFVYGGSPVERSQLMLEYLTKNPDRVIFAPSDDGKSRLAWQLLEGKLNFSPVRTSGFLGFLKSFMEAPQPNELAKLIK